MRKAESAARRSTEELQLVVRWETWPWRVRGVSLIESFWGWRGFRCVGSRFPHPCDFSLCLAVQRNLEFHGEAQWQSLYLNGVLLWHVEFPGFRRL